MRRLLHLHDPLWVLTAWFVVFNPFFSYSTTVSLVFKDSAMVNDSSIRLSDIADVKCDTDKDRIGNSIIGEAAPPGYSRFVMVNDLVTYCLKPLFPASTFETSGNRRILVKTDCDQKSLSEYQDQIKEYLHSNLGWKADQYAYTILNPQITWKCYKNIPMTVEIKGLSNRLAKGRTPLQLVATQGSRHVRIPFQCDLTVSAPVILTKEPIQRGEPVDISRCELQTVDITHFAPVPFTSWDDLKGKTASRSLAAGTILFDRLCNAIPDISKGDQVDVLISRGKVKVSVQGIARENGAVGNTIWVENSMSHKLVRATIKDKGIVEIVSSGERI